MAQLPKPAPDATEAEWRAYFREKFRAMSDLEFQWYCFKSDLLRFLGDLGMTILVLVLISSVSGSLIWVIYIDMTQLRDIETRTFALLLTGLYLWWFVKQVPKLRRMWDGIWSIWFGEKSE